MDIPSDLRVNIMENVTPFAKKMGYNDDQIQDFGIFLESIEAIMEKADPMDWDRNEVHLKDGKVILPGNFEALLKELVVENELYSWFIPEKLGGYGYTNIFVSGVMQLLSYIDISFGIMTGISLTVMEPLVRKPTGLMENIVENFARGKNIGFVGFSEPQAGSNLQNVKSKSVLDGNDYILEGTKIWISNGGYANAGLLLTTNEVDGKADGTNVFIVENPKELVCERLEEKMGLHASPTAQLHFENLRVPKEAIVGKPGNGYRGVLERLMSMRIAVSMQGAASMYRARDLASQYAETRQQFGQPIGQFPAIKYKIDQMNIQVPRMLKFAYTAAYALDRFNKGWIPADVGATGPAAEEQAASLLPGIAMRGLAHYFASSSKTYNAEIAQDMAYDATQIFGGNGFVAENEINKILRDIRVLSIYEGTSEIHDWIISRSMAAVEMIPTLKPLAASYDEKTLYEKMLYLRFPRMENKI